MRDSSRILFGSSSVHTLWSLIDGGVGIVGGLKKISKIDSRGGWNNRGLEKISLIRTFFI